MVRQMLITCVKTGTVYGPEYVQRLQRGVARFCAVSYEFVCYTDKPVDGVHCEPLPVELPGWWAKIGLFKLGKPLVYFDLDTIIVDDLARMLEWEGFGILKNPWLPGYGSGVMKLTGNEGHVWEKFRPGIMSMIRGDQDWLNLVVPGAKTFPPEWFPSFKADKVFDKSPEEAMAVVFHGFPRPHQITSGWVPEYWKG